MTLEAGTRLGHYRILGLLGRGGMADVYRAEDERLGREVALKAVPPEFARDPERVERFEREVRAAAKLNHANIVTVYEYGRGEGQHFYTMALMSGGDLKSRIRASPGGLPPAEGAAVAAAVARALDYAHKRGFVHRDVKPENILFDEGGAPQLTDFGIARAMSESTGLTKTGMSIGSPRYMSPEQARGLRVDGRSDLYSLGVVFYEMLTGSAPFDAEETLAVALAHVNDPVPSLPAELSAWQPVVDRLLAKSPEQRYGSGAELAVALSGGASAASATRVMPAGDAAARAGRPIETAPRSAGAAGTARVAARGSRKAAANRRGLRAALAGGAVALALTVVVGVALRGPGDSGGSSGSSGGDARPPTPPASVLGGGALLVVATEPSGAEVLVDGELVGETPLERSDIRVGVREVTLRHPHYETARIESLSFEDGIAQRVERSLRRGVGRLTLTTTPREAWVDVGGERVANGTPVTLELPAGAATLTLGAPEHRTEAVDVEIRKDGVVRLSWSLDRVAYGSLTLDLVPRDAEVMLPDLAARYHPGVRLPEGRLRVVVRRSGYREAARTLDVAGATRVRIELERRYEVGETFRDSLRSGRSGPEMVVIPSGHFRMGCLNENEGCDDNEKPAHEVRMGREFALGRYEVTVGEFRRFVEATSYVTNAEKGAEQGCWTREFQDTERDGWALTAGRSWLNLENELHERQPAVCVSWRDARAYVSWLSDETGLPYRLPSESEWEYSARAGSTTRYHFGDSESALCTYGNVADETRLPNGHRWTNRAGCSDGAVYPARVGSYLPNGWGLYDMHGNAREWVEDCWNESYSGAPSDGSAWLSAELDCSRRVRRGGAWSQSPRFQRSATRNWSGNVHTNSRQGFRVARTLTP